MVRKAFLYNHIHLIHVPISLLILDQKKHDENKNSINALRVHFFVFLWLQR
jgi:hypothetical protein